MDKMARLVFIYGVCTKYDMEEAVPSCWGAPVKSSTRAEGPRRASVLLEAARAKVSFLLTSLVDWVFGHICYVLSRILGETGRHG